MLETLWEMFYRYMTTPLSWDSLHIVLKFVPFVIFLELPVYLLIFMGVVHAVIRKLQTEEPACSSFSVSCIITCYSEKEAVRHTIRSLWNQLYPGQIQIIAVVDGASINTETYSIAAGMRELLPPDPCRNLIVVPKWQRGGRVSALNTGLNFAVGEIVMALDGDTSFDNNMVARAVRNFADPTVACVAGCLRVRNVGRSIVTRLQAIEYFLSIQFARTGLSEFNMINNISGAFGVFRRSVLDLIMGWDAGTAEDLDLTLRVKNYFGRAGKKMRIVFEPEAIGHTDVPETLVGFLRQRLRWDGDLFFMYFRKHRKSFSPRILGWPNFLFLLLSGLTFQIVMPIVLLLYTAYLFLALPLKLALASLTIVYLFYLALSAVVWFIAVPLVSERFWQDMKLSVWLPLLPFFAFITRLNNCFATFWEILGYGHFDTSMAPWWVTRKNKF